MGQILRELLIEAGKPQVNFQDRRANGWTNLKYAQVAGWLHLLQCKNLSLNLILYRTEIRLFGDIHHHGQANLTQECLPHIPDHEPISDNNCHPIIAHHVHNLP